MPEGKIQLVDTLASRSRSRPYSPSGCEDIVNDEIDLLQDHLVCLVSHFQYAKSIY